MLALFKNFINYDFPPQPLSMLKSHEACRAMTMSMLHKQQH